TQARIDQDRFIDVATGARRFALAQQSETTPHVGAGAAWIDFDGLTEIGNCSVVVALLVPDLTANAIGVGVDEREPDRSIEVKEGTIERTEALPQLAPIAKCGGVVWSDADRHIVVCQRAVGLTLGFPGLGAISEGCRVTRVTFDRLIEHSHCLVDLTLRRLHV